MKKHPFHLRRLFSLIALTATFASVSLLTHRGVAQTIAVQAPAETVDEPAQTPRVGETAPDFELEGLKGNKIKLSTLVKQGPVVLMMLRGFPGYQCPICTAQVGQFLNKAKELEKAGARVLMVYPGPADGLKAHADEFVRGKDMPLNFYLAIDPDYLFTNQYNLRWDAQGETSYPATFVLDTEQTVLFEKVSHSHGDRSSVDEVLAALAQ